MKKHILLFLLLVFSATLFAAKDAEAIKNYEKGYAAYQEGKYHQAAQLFEDTFLMTGNPTIKANCLRAQIGAWRMCEMPYKDFKAIEALLTAYPEFADFSGLVEREFEIATSYYNGTRQPAYYQLRWIPWLTDDNKCAEIFLQALKRAPFSPAAPAARLRLAHYLDQEHKTLESLEQYRLIIRDYPDSRESKYALLALAEGLFIMAERGDGDGRYITEAHEVLMTFRQKYPDAGETAWVDRKIAQYKNLQGQRLYDMARYYNDNGRGDVAGRYLASVLQDYPESSCAPDAEKLLVKIDKTFIPGDFRKQPASTKPVFRSYSLPADAKQVLINPGEKGNHFLVPVPNILDKSNQEVGK